MNELIFIIKDGKLIDGYMVVSDDFINDSDVMHQIASLTGERFNHTYTWINLSSLNRLSVELSKELFDNIFPYYREALNVASMLYDGGELD